MNGSGRIDAVPVSGVWTMPLGTQGAGSQLSGEVELSERFVDTFNIGLPPGSVSGKGVGQVTIDLNADAPASFALSSNLQGVGINIAALSYRKPAGARGSLSVQGKLGGEKTGPPVVERLSIDAAGLKANGAVKISNAGTLDTARFYRVRVGDWLDAPMTLTGRGRNTAPAITIGGGSLDLRRLPAQGGGEAIPLPFLSP